MPSMAARERSTSEVPPGGRKDSAQDVVSKRSRSSTTPVGPISNSKKQSIAATSIVNGSKDGGESLQFAGSPVSSSALTHALAQVKTSRTGEGNQPIRTSRASIFGLRKVLSRTGAFVKEVCQADVGDARSVNAYLDQSRSKDQVPPKPTNIQIGQHEWINAQGQWFGFSCSNTPITEKADPFALVNNGMLSPDTRNGMRANDQDKRKWWKTWKMKPRYVQPSASILVQRTSGPRNEQNLCQLDLVEAGPSNWHSTPRISTCACSPHDSSADDAILLSTLITATRQYHQARLIESYLPWLPKKHGKRHNVHDTCYYIGTRELKWNDVLREVRFEKSKLAQWEKQEALRREISGRFWGRGKNSRPMSERPTTPWLDELDKVVQGLHERGACKGIKAKQICAWIEEFVRARNPAFPPASQDASVAGKNSIKSELDSDTGDSDGEVVSTENSTIGDLVESLAFDALAERLADDLLLVQWVFDGRSSTNDHCEDGSLSPYRDLKGAIERVRNEWFTLVFVQEGCTLDGQAAALPARVYKILSKKGRRKVKDRAKEMAERWKENDGESSEDWYIWTLTEEDGDDDQESRLEK